jgi:hypothetical protein
MSQAGRPVASSPVKNRAREIEARHTTLCRSVSATESVAIIGRETGLSRSRVWSLIAVARGIPVEVELRGLDQDAEPPRPLAPVFRPMRPAAVWHRAWLALHLDGRLRALEWPAQRFWLEVVLAVHAIGDGFRILFSECGFESAEDFAVTHGGDEQLLKRLVRRRLIDFDGEAVSLPTRLGVTRPERPGGSAIPPMPSPGARDRRQGNLGPMGMRGAESNFHPLESNPNESSFSPRDSNFSGVDSSFATLESSLARGGKGTTTTTTTKEESYLGSGSLATAGAPETPGESSPDSNADSNADSNETGAGDAPSAGLAAPHVALAAELATLMGHAGQPAPSDLNLVQAMLGEGLTADRLRDECRAILGRARPPSHLTFRYLAAVARDSLRPRPAPPTAVMSPAPSPEPPEDPAASIAWLSNDPDNPRLAASWPGIRAALREQVGDAEYCAWVRPLVLLGLDGDEIVLALPSGFVRDRVRDHHGPRIGQLWLAAYPEARRVDFRVRAPPGE